MRFYDRYILPPLIRLACSTEPVSRQRGKVIPLARGDVLEVGIGPGLNLPYYDPRRVRKIWGFDPSGEILAYARKQAERFPFEIELVQQSAESIPLEDGSVDTVVVTYTLCTIPEVARSLAEMRRVLKPEGRLVFCEHGEAPEDGIRRWQGRLNPIWRAISGGCHLNRPIPALIEGAGFRIGSLEKMYLPGLKPMSFNYWGTAEPV